MTAPLHIAGTTLHLGDCLDVLREMPDASVDACVCDPPYELGFMGKKWDATGIAFQSATWAEVLRVLKPGGHLLAFGGTRTYHRVACAVEDAGFEIRDCIMWIYGSGFPKSLDVSKAIDKAAGAERVKKDWVGRANGGAIHGGGAGQNARCPSCGKLRFDHDACSCPKDSGPATDDARRWQGWGTALKPAFEPVIVARKPLVGTVAENVLAHGTGAINVGACRIATDWSDRPESWKRSGHSARPEADKIAAPPGIGIVCHPGGRWPANVILDEEAGAALDAQSGDRPSPWIGNDGKGAKGGKMFGGSDQRVDVKPEYRDSGGASRFFYCAKASKRDRGEGNNHPTVKPVSLMRWLTRLVTPPGGIVLDPFMGSGTTGVACATEGFQFIGIEREPAYFAIAERRIRSANAQGSLFPRCQSPPPPPHIQ